MKIVVPMAGRGSRFATQGVQTPKPLIQVDGKPMVYWALQSLKGLVFNQVIFIALQEHDRQFDLKRLLPSFTGEGIDVQLVLLDDVTEGQLCTVLTADRYIDTPEDILIASSDTLVISDIGKDVAQWKSSCAGLISVANMPDDRWSFARVDDNGVVVEVAEKIRISPHASTGLYYFSDGSKFVNYGREMVARQEKTRGEYYVMPVYQKYIDDGAEIRLSVASQMWDMGTPDALQTFLKTYLHKEGV